MNTDILKENLLKLNYEVSEFDNKDEARNYLNKVIINETVGFGGSVTLEELGIFESLSNNNEVYWHMHETDKEKAMLQRKLARTANIYISSVNGISETGEIINIDHTGNRVSSISFGHKKVYLIFGINKIVPTYEEALYRAQNIAAPLNAQRLGVRTPCVIKKDKCYDCKSPERICRNLSVLTRKPTGSDYEIIIIHEELGY